MHTLITFRLRALIWVLLLAAAWLIPQEAKASCDFAAGTVTASVASVCQGGSVTLNHTGSAYAKDFNWQVSTDGGNTWSNIAGATSSSYTVNNLQQTSQFRMKMTVDDSDCTENGKPAYTDPVTVTVTVCCTPPTVYSVTGGGSYCSGGSGMAVGLSGSQSGISYQLYRNGSAVGAAVAGTGSAISFGNQTVAGTYTVKSVANGTYCGADMNGSAVVSITPLPTPPSINTITNP